MKGLFKVGKAVIAVRLLHPRGCSNLTTAKVCKVLQWLLEEGNEDGNKQIRITDYITNIVYKPE